MVSIASVLALSACTSREQAHAMAEFRNTAFHQCMRALPAGPQSTKYNDWAEVVSACDNYAQRLEIRNWSSAP